MLGMLDRGDDAGTFAVNTVGENLVAMTLPGGNVESKNKKPAKKKDAPKTKQASVKKANKV